ncbi:MAG: thiamine pyrophosphate-binding protein [Lachnospiraceae bacterium]|nr:thiamine pyrophosphate-binding protein [Lachnospiraceae bacterium]
MIKLSDYVVKFIEETGIGHVFMIPGGGAMHLNDSLGNSDKLEYVVCLHEQACSIAAEAYARVNNKLGVCMVTTGPGGTNAITGVAASYIESTPVLVISGQVKIMDQIRDQGIRQQGMQEVDIVSVVRPITKYAVMVNDPKDIRYHLERALYEATSGRKGPVWIDIPLDIQATMIEENELKGFVPIDDYKDTRSIEAEVDKTIEALNKSERPVLLLGNGIRLSNAFEDLKKLLNILNIPVLTTWNGIDLVPDDYEYFFGRPGGMGQRYANLIQQNSDLFISIGARMNLLQTGYNFDGFARDAYKIMVDIDEAELHKINVRPDLAICADAGDYIRDLVNNKNNIKEVKRDNWINYCKKCKDRFPIVTEEYKEQKELVNTYCLIDAITDAMKEDDIYVSGSSGTCIDVSMQTFRVKSGQRVFATKGLASMGFGLPASIGACLASGKRRTVCVNGDGGFMMNIQELETLSRLNLPVKIFVLYNQGYGQIHTTQKNVFSGHYVACDSSSNLSIPNIASIAKAFDLQVFEIKNNSEIKEKVSAVLESDGPSICVVYVPIDFGALPKQVSYKRKDGQMESLPLEYMNPPLSEEELEKWMIIPMYKMEI